MKRANYGLRGAGLLLVMILSCFRHGSANPVLTVGVWKNITPAGVTMSEANHVFCQGMAIDPRHPSTLYLCVCAYDVSKGGLYKTTDGGSTWNRIGNLDEPIHVVVDRHKSNHLSCVDGVRAAT